MTALPLPVSVSRHDEPAAAGLLPDRRRLALRLGLIVVVVAALGVAVTSLPGLDELRDRLASASPEWLAIALALQACSCLAFVAAFRGVFCRRLPWRLSYEIAMAAQGTNVLLPSGGAGGLALAAWALRRTGMPAQRLARRTVAFYVLTSSVNFMTAVFAGGALALGLLAGGGSLALTGGPAAAAALVIVVVLALPSILGHDRGQRLSRRAVADALSGGIADAVMLARSGNPQILAGAVGFMAFDVAALAAAFAAIGALPPIGVLLLGYVVGQLGGLIPLPGGVGGSDGGLIAALVLYGTPLGAAAAAVLAYRAFQLGLPAVLGALSVARLPGVLERAPDVEELYAPPRSRPVTTVRATRAFQVDALRSCGRLASSDRRASAYAASTPPTAPNRCACQEIRSCGSSPWSSPKPQTARTIAPIASSVRRLDSRPRLTR
ncbi:MAG: putative heme transporter [Solirubrobacteraceae bacterium]|nr:putative heme transporter [Solirubrobacteraceae bacterium]